MSEHFVCVCVSVCVCECVCVLSWCTGSGHVVNWMGDPFVRILCVCVMSWWTGSDHVVNEAKIEGIGAKNVVLY